ncbi:hypothetical protein ABK040_015150 [Willaertia magna]
MKKIIVPLLHSTKSSNSFLTIPSLFISSLSLQQQKIITNCKNSKFNYLINNFQLVNKKYYASSNNKGFLSKLFGLDKIEEEEENNNSLLNKQEEKDKKIKETFQEERKKLKDHLNKERDQIYTEISHSSPMTEIKQALKHQGKLYVTISSKINPPIGIFPLPESLLKSDVLNLKKEKINLFKEFKKSKCNILFLHFTEFGAQMTSEWKEIINEYKKDIGILNRDNENNYLQVLELSVSESLVVSWLQSLIFKNLSKKLSENERENYFLTFVNSNLQTLSFKDAIGVTNSKTLYVFIIDSNGNIRWKAVGRPDEREKEVLRKALNQMLHSK